MTHITQLLDIHPLREVLYNELHSRPFQVIPSPARITHLALQVNESQKAAQFRHLQKLHEWLGYDIPEQATHCYEKTFGHFRIRWEQHLEFTTYTLIHLSPERSDDPFSESAIVNLPPAWLAALPGTLVAGFHIAIEDARAVEEPEPVQVKPWFEHMRLIGSNALDGAARIWTSFQLHHDGLGRLLVYNKQLSDSQLGRLVQRLVEIETYRLMALLALPDARRISPLLGDMDEQLNRLTDTLAHQEHRQAVDESALLAELTQMAARVEAFRAQTTFRFTATRAYAEMIETRLQALREDEVSGHLTINEFLSRRLLPAVNTCQAVSERLEDISRRVDRASDMMRTRVDMTIQQQNRELLGAMNQRSKIQLMMQHTVEGLSVAAISYYLVGLGKYLLEAVYGTGWHFNKSLAMGGLVPLVLISVWWATRRIHHRFHALAYDECDDDLEKPHDLNRQASHRRE